MSAASKEHGARESGDAASTRSRGNASQPVSENSRKLEQQLKELEAAYAPYRSGQVPKN